MRTRKESLIFILSEFITTHEESSVYDEDVQWAKKELEKLEKPREMGVSPCVKVIEAFGAVNPTVGRLYGMKSQREAADRLLKQFGEEELFRMINALPIINVMPYAPKATTPSQFEMKVGQIMAFIAQEKNKQGSAKQIGVTF